MTNDGELLRGALRVLAIVFAFDIAATGIYGYAPAPLYFAILAAYPPILAALAAACIAARGKTRGLFVLALTAFAIVALISFADFGVTRMRVQALRVLSSKAFWDLATSSSICGLYLTLLAATTVARAPLVAKVAWLALALDAAATLGFVVVKWLHNTPPLVPLFYGLLYAIPAMLLFELTAPEHRASFVRSSEDLLPMPLEVVTEPGPPVQEPRRPRRRRGS